MSREIKYRAWNEKTKRFTKDSDNVYLSRNDSGTFRGPVEVVGNIHENPELLGDDNDG